MLSLHDHLEDFLAEKQRENLSPNSLSYYRSALEKFLAFLATVHSDALLEPDLVNVQDIRNYAAALQDTMSPGGAHARLRALRVFSNWLVADGVLEASPVAKVKLPRLPRHKLPVVGSQDFRALLQAAKASSKPLRDDAILKTLFDSGLRASELVALTLDDVQQGGLLRVVAGKGQKDRVVPVSRSVFRAISAYHRSERPPSETAQIFLGHGSEPLTRSGLLKLLYRLSQSAGLESKSPHAFRRGFVVSYISNQGDAFSAKRILGHETLTMVDRYAAMGAEDLQYIHRRASPVLSASRNRESI